jgi:Lhr-like helicase
MFDEYYDFRRALVEALKRDLMGPAMEDETIVDPPITRYITGILFPQSAEAVDPAEDVDPDSAIEADAEDTGNWDPAVAMSYVRYPSSLGLTFAVDQSATSSIVVHVEGARYVALEGTADEKPASPNAHAVAGKATGEQYLGRRARRHDQPPWRRQALDIPPIPIDISTIVIGHTEPIGDGIGLFRRVRAADESGRVAVTIILINTRAQSSGFGRDADAIFQARLRVTADGSAAFVHRAATENEMEEDAAANRLLYRTAISFATGHGTAVDWHQGATDPLRATELCTCIIPRFELKLSDTNPEIPTDLLGMRHLATAPRPDVLHGLEDLCSRYDTWIALTKGEVSTLEHSLRTVAEQHLERCREASRRMRAGVRLLSEDSDAWEAFRLANRAMLMQRARSDWLAQGALTPAPDLESDQPWRPFQIAFILLCLIGIADPNSDDRQLTDLLWFPTGGGKTEAYLGLLAFTILLRRLRTPDRGHGVTVIMRYTLRLLTLQQFERAALLICSLESLRRADARLGDQPVEIGLWVGRGATPNSLSEARVSIDRLRQGGRLEKSNPLQLQRCPWCATPIEPRNLWIAKSPARLVTACRTADCEFTAGLPVCVVDDDIYTRHPSLIIATVDKFASMPWRESCRSLFNDDLPGVAPPELIIQDELHLISGPLGTLAGLYETAVDMLCAANGSRPKVVASTATIRRADDQTRSLFDRPVRQFPPPGIDAASSFFATEADTSAKGTRLYVGVTAPGTSQTTLLVRTYAALLQAASELDGSPAIKDPYWTLVGYFNSLRVLGGARMQVQDDVNERLELLAASHRTAKRDIERRIELTSREPSGEIPDHLRRMAIAHPSEEAVDVILATNMISVGVDITRLGLMVVMGQPQSTSEYIQATSRVGRRFPGLVVTMLNSAKSRDRSHYESFRDFHAALYRQVESSSVTPFSARARSRALHAVLIALARLTIPGLRSNDGARNVAQHTQELALIKAVIVDRVRNIDDAERDHTAAELDQIIAEWVRRAEDEPDLVYANQHHPDKALLGDAGLAGEDFQSTFPTLWSLRDVDLSSNLYQVV